MRLARKRPGAEDTRGAERVLLLPWTGGSKFNTLFDVAASREIDRLVIKVEEQETRIAWLESALLFSAGRAA